MNIGGGNPRIERCLIIRNHSHGDGGAIFCYNSTTSNIINCTISENTASYDVGGIYLQSSDPQPVLINCILWNNTPQEIEPGKVITIGYSNIKGGWIRTGNINSTPHFVDPDNNNFNLQQTSPCVDAGTNLFIRNEDTLVYIPDSLYDGIAPDMGAFESSFANALVVGDHPALSYQLYQNYPNPFNPVTTIEFSISRSGFVTLKIYNPLGQLITTLVAKNLRPGNYQYTWNTETIASGIYLYQLQAGRYIETKKMILLR